MFYYYNIKYCSYFQNITYSKRYLRSQTISSCNTVDASIDDLPIGKHINRNYNKYCYNRILIEFETFRHFIRNKLGEN